MIHADIHHHDLGARMAGQNIDSRPLTQEVVNHLASNFFRISADSFGDHPVVRRKGIDDFLA